MAARCVRPIGQQEARMRISRRVLLLGAVGAVSGCEERPSPGKTERQPVVTPGADPGYLSSESTRYHGTFRSSVYDQVVNDVLLQRAKPDESVICQMFVRPSRAYEAAFFLQHRNPGWQLIVRRAIVSLGSGVIFRLDKGMDRSRITASMIGSIEESARPLPQRLVSALQRVWTEMLLRTRGHSMPEMDLHTSIYSFAHHHLAGVTIRNGEQSLAGKLVQLGGMLLESTTLRGAKYEAALEEVGARAAGLLKDLSQLRDMEPLASDWALKRLYGDTTQP